jgi:type IX secretion system PorP/SprF family membrane protein
MNQTSIPSYTELIAPPSVADKVVTEHVSCKARPKAYLLNYASWGIPSRRREVATLRGSLSVGPVGLNPLHIADASIAHTSRLQQTGNIRLLIYTVYQMVKQVFRRFWIAKSMVYVLLCVLPTIIEAQQMPQWSQFVDMGFVWNPAMTAKWSRIEGGLSQVNTMSGFDGAPRTSLLHVQVPFGYQYNKMRIRSNAMGVAITSDRLGPMDFLQLNGNYVYRWHPELLGNRKDVIAIGAGVSGQRVGIRTNEWISFSPEEQAIWLGNVDQETLSSNRWNASLGLFYSSVSDFYYDEDSYYVGLSFNNLNINRVDFTGMLSYQPVIHSSLLMGYRKVLSKELILEPSLLFFMTGKGQLISSATVRLEGPGQYWLMLAAEQQGNFSLGAGWMFDKSSILRPIVKDGLLKIGARAEYNLGPVRKYGGFGFEIYVGYIFDLDEYY